MRFRSRWRWKSEHDAAAVLLKSLSAMEKAVVDGVFKKECFAYGSAEQKKAAAGGALAEKSDSNWEGLKMVVQLLGPLEQSMDAAQSNRRGLGKVQSAMFTLQSHFADIEFTPPFCRANVKQYVLSCCQNLAPCPHAGVPVGPALWRKP